MRDGELILYHLRYMENVSFHGDIYRASKCVNSYSPPEFFNTPVIKLP